MAKGLAGGSLGFSEHVTLEPGSVPSVLLDKHLFVLLLGMKWKCVDTHFPGWV